jgi:recombination protein RecA
LKFWSSVRLEVRRVETLKQGTEMVGVRTRVKVVKNKVAAPFRQAEFDIMFGKGISRSGGILDIGTELGIISKTGTWFTYNENRLGQGRENAKQYLEEHTEMLEELETRIRDESVEKVILEPVGEVEE